MTATFFAFKRRWAGWLPLLAVVGLSGCFAPETDDLTQWMAVQRSVAKPKVDPISEPKIFVPSEYKLSTAISPFSDAKLTTVLQAERSAAPASSLIAAELNRRKEPLEDQPLDVMAMVGLLDKAGQKVALVRVNNLLYQVKPGNHMGQNYGRITAISENQITLREIVQDAAGEWIERSTTLALQEAAGK
jgi:type IV pilus assembly protein PilP